MKNSMHQDNIVAAHPKVDKSKHHHKKPMPTPAPAPAKNPPFGSPAWRAKYNLGNK